MNHPFNFSLRHPSEADIPAMVTVCNSWWRALSGNDFTTEATMRSEWHAPNTNPSLDWRVAVTSEQQIVANATIYSRPPYVFFHTNIQVHPDWDGYGIGSALTSWLEERVRERLPEAPPEARVLIATGIPSTHHMARQLLLEHGYTLTRTFHEMDITLPSQPDAPVFPSGIRIKTFDPDSDKEAAYRAHQDAFRDHYGNVNATFEEGFPQWWHHITHHPHYDPSTFYLAMEGEEIAGYIFCYLQDYEIADMAWIENLGVRRPWRQKGLGLALLHHAFGEVYRRGQNRIGLAVDADSLTGATRLYEKAGMKTFRQFDRYTKEVRPGIDLMTQQVA